MRNRIISISREFGSGGRTIGRETAAKLGIPKCVEILSDLYRDQPEAK